MLIKRIMRELMPAGLARRLHLKGERAEAHRQRVRFYRELLGDDDLVFDVGANVGDRTAALLEAGCRVVAVEPQAECCRCLRRLEKANPRLTVLQKACGRTAGHAELRTGGGTDVLASLSPDYIARVSNSGRFAKHCWTERMSVAVCSLDDLIGEFGLPRYIKIDVEGYEPEVFSGLHTCPSLLSFEYTPELSDEMQVCLAECERLGLEEFNMSPGESMRFSRKAWVKGDRMRAIIDALEGDTSFFGDIFARKSS
jgi:FkbM family methyltransferase